MDDFVIGASHTIINPRRKGVGQTYIIYGSQSAFPARMALSDLDGSNGFRINGIGTVDYYGVYTRTAGDFNDDGIDDFIAGASGEGASFVIYGRDFGFGRVPGPGVPGFGVTPPVLPAAARVYGSDAEPLQFNELADPTGPNPLPVGTPTDLTDPNTPGYVAANQFEPVDVLRPDQVIEPAPTQPPSMPSTPVVVAVPAPEDQPGDMMPSAPSVTPTVAVTPPGEADNNPVSGVKVGALHAFFLWVLFLVRVGRNYPYS